MPVMAKKKTVPPVRTGRAVNAWVDPALYDALMKYLESQRARPTVTSVVETALKEFLTSEGLWPPPAPPQ